MDGSEPTYMTLTVQEEERNRRVGTSHGSECGWFSDATVARNLGETAGGTSPLCVKCVAGKARFFTPWDERRQVVRGHACGDSARIFFDERRPEAHVLHSHPHLPISHGLKAP